MLSKPEEIKNFLKRIIKINEDTRTITPADQLLQIHVKSILNNYHILINLLNYVQKNNHCNLLNIEAIREKPLPLELRNISEKSFLPFIKITGTSFPKITFPFNEIVSNYIEVELYEVNDEELRDLDRLEWHPGWYERIKMTTTSWEECEVYHMPIEQNEWTDNREEYLLTQPLEEISMYSWFSN